jgi:septum formation protein
MPLYRLILASTSERRRHILTEAGFAFECFDPGDAEDAIQNAATPNALAIAKARLKAEAAAQQLGGAGPAIVIGADTLVATGAQAPEVIGKPLDRNDAKCILTRLSGTRHRVISGLCLWPVVGGGGGARASRPLVPWTTDVSTWVTMRRMEAAEIDAYVASGESDGKAGAYAIQEKGDRFVAGLEGSFANVVGFPIEVFREALPARVKEWGFEF